MGISELFKELKEGDKVAITINKSFPNNIPKRIHGRTGVIKGKRGKAYIVNLKENNKEKTFIIKPEHLKKLK